MKYIVQVNLGNFGSTGTIMCGITKFARNYEFNVEQVYPGAKSNRTAEKGDYILSSDFFKRVNQRLSYYTGKNGCFAYFSTKRLLRRLKNTPACILHLHNLHNSYINLPLLFRYIKKHDIPVIWTLHDCWSFTGQCPYFDIAKCDKWKTGCHHCPQYRSYPASYVDRTKTMYRLKKKWFIGVKDMTIVTPSQWLADLVKQSYLKDYPVKVIHNGIDLSVFKPTESDFRTKYHCEDKYLLLGVAFGWGKRKGLDVFVELAKRLDDRFQIVLVGTDDNVDKQLPNNIISVHRTQNQTELAEIYTAADLFVNPTREENYPTVNMESLACGTPVLTFRTGGSPEIPDETCGSVVDCDDIDAMEREIRRIAETKPFSKEACLKRAESFDNNERFEEYVNHYKRYGEKKSDE